MENNKDGCQYHYLSSDGVRVSEEDLIQVEHPEGGTIYVYKHQVMPVTTKEGVFYIFKDEWDNITKYSKHGK